MAEARVSAEGVLTEEYLQDLRCPQCKEMREGRGCQCSLDRLYRDAHSEVMEWYNSLSEADKESIDGVRFDPLSIVRSTLSRERRRAGLTHRPVDPSDPHGISAAEDERLGLNRELGVKAKWFKPTHKITPRAEREPI